MRPMCRNSDSQMRLRKKSALERTPILECAAVMLNINYGHNMELMKNCKRLHDYAYFVNEVNQNLNKGYSYEKSVNLAMEHCEKSDILSNVSQEYQPWSVVVLLLFSKCKNIHQQFTRRYIWIGLS